MSQFNFGERILKMINTRKKLDNKDYHNLINNVDSNMEMENNNFNTNNSNNFFDNADLKIKLNEKNYFSEVGQLNITYFSTSEGTIGVIINLNKEIFEYLSFLQKEIIKVIVSPCNFDYEKWRSVKVNLFVYKI